MGYFPLVVDLDGTLIRTDMLHESALQACRDRPLDVLRIPAWLLKGKAVMKQKLAAQCEFDAASLPYHLELVEWLREQRASGRKVILCTASDLSIATAIAQHLDLFDEVIASNGSVNLAGKHKAQALEERYGKGGFDYVGNSHADVPVWQRARRAIVVSAPAEVIRKAGVACEVERVFPRVPLGLGVLARMLRVHQWAKNALLLVPLLASHQLDDPDTWLFLLLAIVSFSLCASSVYIANDLMDLESDRQHPRKRDRPFASGIAPAWTGVVLAPILLLLSLLLAVPVGSGFVTWLVVYFIVTCAYSWGLKRLALIDCLTLAVLYTLRIVAGAAAAGLMLSYWLLAFSGFLFLSLAFVKRYAELQVQLSQGKEKAHGRGYVTSDASLVQMLGISSAYSAVVVLALYLDSDTVVELYQSPEIVWGAVPVVLFWISWMWLRAHRGEMHDDPLVFAMKDKASLLAGVVFGVVMIAGAVGVPW
ncbi:UbiA family prenyltransferase [Candidimonas sp. SYP-B2681]|uniref:UbiA family prenyltransferase n=1 Tax=Candidimonas sp. SYP-B2681 TaxID=2497686 RepID=UPI000F878288|nr:UbiA family prenyltransferase [Candidimonas sp. SYP-B2681]RTZ43184.1 UbiA family prenyltransferase [Candidimonas sp. SYP-B2681]